MLDMPALLLNYGLHKLVFRLQVETFTPEVVMFKEAHTYVNITKSPLVAIMIAGSVATVSRGWDQGWMMRQLTKIWQRSEKKFAKFFQNLMLRQYLNAPSKILCTFNF